MNVIQIAKFDFRIESASLDFIKIVVSLNGQTPSELWGEVAKFHFDPVEFNNPLHTQGYHAIFTCSCGCPGCDGWFNDLQVEKNENLITWFIEKRMKLP